MAFNRKGDATVRETEAMNGIVVTGASSGIGRAIAVRLAEAVVGRKGRPEVSVDAPEVGLSTASHVLIGYRKNREGAESTASRVREIGCQASVMTLDLSEPSSVDRFVDEAFERLGTIDVWVNNAGADVLTGEAGDWDFDRKLQTLLEVDVRGTIRLSRRVVTRWLDRPEGIGAGQHSDALPASMVMIGWDQAPHGMEGDAGMMFGPAKAAVMAFSNSLAQSVAPGVRVNCVAPGWIQTAWGESTQGYWDRRARRQALMGRWGNAEDVAEAVAWLCDPAAGFLTGQTIQVNGGWNRRYDEPDRGNKGSAKESAVGDD